MNQTFVPLIPGVIHVTGPHDVGKTTFALECGAHPSRICFFDSDVKGRATVQQLLESGIEFGAYYDLNEMNKGKNELQFYQSVLDIIYGIRPGDFDAIIWDTWERFSGCFHPYVVANPSQFRRSWSPKGDIKGAQQWKEAQQLEAQIIGHIAALAPVFIIISHLKDHRAVGGVKTGKKVPDTSRTISRVANFRLWLNHNPNGPVPIGLVYKRMDVKKVTDAGIRTVSVLPRKLTPHPDHESLWDTIRWYFENPIGTRTPGPHETPDAYELTILDGTLSDDEKHVLELALKYGGEAWESEEEEEEVEKGNAEDEKTGKDEEGSEPGKDKSPTEFSGTGDGVSGSDDATQVYISTLRDAGMPDAFIVKSLQSNLGLSYLRISNAMGISVPDVIRMARESEPEERDV